jgi:hypothetical protein
MPTLSAHEFGAEGVVAADAAYQGSRFADIKTALFANPYQPVWNGPGHLPTYRVTLASLLHGLLRPGNGYLFRQASERVVDSQADLRWGIDGRGYRRLVHPNAICLLGTWEITRSTEYSGYFRQGSRALVVARYSTCCTETRRGHSRSLALAVKLFPTTDPEHPQLLVPASLITQQDIGGDDSIYINDVELRNAPNTTSWRRGSGLPGLIVTGAVFNVVDRQPTIRQLYEIAELGNSSGQPTRTPQFLRLIVAAEQPRIEGDELDFRDEILQHIFNAGDPTPRRRLDFDIEITDEGQTHGTAALQWRTFSDWRRIGKLSFDDAVASYNGDFVLHYHHPTWRDERDDPATGTRIGGRKRVLF